MTPDTRERPVISEKGKALIADLMHWTTCVGGMEENSIGAQKELLQQERDAWNALADYIASLETPSVPTAALLPADTRERPVISEKAKALLHDLVNAVEAADGDREDGNAADAYDAVDTYIASLETPSVPADTPELQKEIERLRGEVVGMYLLARTTAEDARFYLTRGGVGHLHETEREKMDSWGKRIRDAAEKSGVIAFVDEEGEE